MNWYTGYPWCGVRLAVYFTAVLIISTLPSGCDLFNSDAEDGPNAPVGGSTTTGYTNIGDKSDIYFNLSDVNPVFDGVKDSVVVLHNNDGNITWFIRFTVDTAITKALDTLLGIQSMSTEVKKQILDTYLENYGVVLDSTNKDRITLTTTIKGRVTSDGIQEYMTSANESKPFTIIRFNANVGDKYEMTRASDGAKIVRTVVYHSTDNDYPIGFWDIKVFKTEEVSSDPLIKKITYVTNHKFGLVGIELDMLDGTKRNVTVWPPNL